MWSDAEALRRTCVRCLSGLNRLLEPIVLVWIKDAAAVPASVVAPLAEAREVKRHRAVVDALAEDSISAAAVIEVAEVTRKRRTRRNSVGVDQT